MAQKLIAGQCPGELGGFEGTPGSVHKGLNLRTPASLSKVLDRDLIGFRVLHIEFQQFRITFPAG
jgi:hypothetical protein